VRMIDGLSDADLILLRERMSGGFILRGDGLGVVGMSGKGLEVLAFLMGENDVVMGIADPASLVKVQGDFASIAGTIDQKVLRSLMSGAADDWEDLRLGTFVPDGATKPHPTRKDYLRGRTAGHVRVLGLVANFFDADSRYQREFFLATGKEYGVADAMWDTGAAVVEGVAGTFGLDVDTDMGADGYGGAAAVGQSAWDGTKALLQNEDFVAMVGEGIALVGEAVTS